MSDANKKRVRLPNRREVLALGVGAFLVAALPRDRASRAQVIRRRVPMMGTVGEVVAIHADAAVARTAVDRAIETLLQVEHSMSRFDAASDIGRANRGAYEDGVVISSDTAFVLREALAWAEKTDGAFDPCLGKAVTLWDVKQRREPPQECAVSPLAGRRLYRALDLSTLGGQPAVRLLEGDASIDLGGIAKGHGVDRAVAVLRAHGIERGFVNVGGDLYALGHSEDGDAWRVGVRSPSQPERIERTLSVSDMAVATSGDYEQNFMWRGRRYHHLLDASTAAPRLTDAHTLTVIADRCLTADAAATAAFGLPTAEADALLGRVAISARRA